MPSNFVMREDCTMRGGVCKTERDMYNQKEGTTRLREDVHMTTEPIGELILVDISDMRNGQLCVLLLWEIGNEM